MISLERVSNGYIVRIEEEDENLILVAQKEYDSMNVAMAAVFKELLNRWHDEEEAIKLKVEIGP